MKSGNIMHYLTYLQFCVEKAENVFFEIFKEHTINYIHHVT